MGSVDPSLENIGTCKNIACTLPIVRNAGNKQTIHIGYKLRCNHGNLLFVTPPASHHLHHTTYTCHTYLSDVWHIKNNTEQRGTIALTVDV